MESEPFLDAYRETKRNRGEEVSRLCLQCHAPFAAINADWELKEKLTWEGVNCDICHSITSVDHSGPNPKMLYDVGDVKRGPIRDAESGAHEVAYSDLHTHSSVCAGCHEFTNSDGIPIMSTFSEWQSSTAAREGKHCQTCHMGATEGDIVDPRITRVAHAEVNLHEVPGGHSIDQLNKALRVRSDFARDGDSLAVVVQLMNKGAGHCVPTGMPGRRVILELQVRPYGREVSTETRIFGRTFVDAEGSIITRDSQYFAPGVKLDFDTRILPDETRTERFAFPVPHDVTVAVQLRLTYEHAPLGGPEGRTQLVFFTQSRTLLPEGAPNR
jgi:hypothetical protein